MRNFIVIFCISIVILISCTKNGVQKQKEVVKPVVEEKLFKEIGDSILLSYDFPKHWYSQIYDEGNVMSKSDSVNQEKFDQLTFFDKVGGKRIMNINKLKVDIAEAKKNIKIDSIFAFDSLKIGNNKLVYVKSYKTFLEKNYDFPPTEQSVDVLFYYKGKFQHKVNVYYEINYPYSVDTKIGYLSKEGILNTKSFKIDEEEISFIENRKEDLTKFLK